MRCKYRGPGIVAVSLLLGSLWSAVAAAQADDTPEELLGLVVRDLEPGDVKNLGLDAKVRGAVVDEVRIGGAADTAGLEAGDVITHVDERSVTDRSAFLRAVERRHPGDRVRFRAHRSGRERRFTVELGGDEGRQSAPRVFGTTVRSMGRAGVQLGVQCVDLDNPQLAAYFGVQEGVLVTDIVPGSGAEAAGVQGGDVLLAVEGASVHDAAELRQELQRFDAGDEVEVRLRRSGKEHTLRVELQRDNNTFAAFSWPRSERWSFGEDTEELRRELQELREELQRLEQEWKSERR